MRKLPPCDHDECGVTKCSREAKRGPLPVRPESDVWVSVNDELPKESGKHRVMLQRVSTSVTTEETETLFFKKEHRSYWGVGGDWDVVTYWKPNAKDEPQERRMNDEI